MQYGLGLNQGVDRMISVVVYGLPSSRKWLNRQCVFMYCSEGTCLQLKFDRITCCAKMATGLKVNVDRISCVCLIRWITGLAAWWTLTQLIRLVLTNSRHQLQRWRVIEPCMLFLRRVLASIWNVDWLNCARCLNRAIALRWRSTEWTLYVLALHKSYGTCLKVNVCLY